MQCETISGLTERISGLEFEYELHFVVEGRSLGFYREYLMRTEASPKREFQNFLDLNLVTVNLAI